MTRTDLAAQRQIRTMLRTLILMTALSWGAVVVVVRLVEAVL